MVEPEQDGHRFENGFDWGRPEAMSAFEAVMWRADTDPQLSSTVVALELLDRVPEWDRLFAAHDWATRMVPRFRDRVIEPPLGLGRPRWSPDPHFELGYHLRRTRLPLDAGWPGLFVAAERVARAPFERTRAPWEAVLYEGLPGGKAAYLLKMHHAATDGMGGIQLLSQVHSRRREHDSAKPQPGPLETRSLSPVDFLLRQIADDARAVPRLIRGAAGHAGRALGHPRRTVLDAVRYGMSLRRVFSPPAAVGSPLLAKRSLSWRFGALDVSFNDLRAAGKAAGGVAQ